MKKYYLFIIIISLIGLQSCFKDSEEFDPYNDSFVNSPTLFLVRSADDKSPLQDVNISVGDQSISTDSYGSGFMKSALVNSENGSLARLTKPGFMPAYAFIHPAGKTRTLRKIELSREQYTEITSTTTPTTLEYEKTTLRIPAGTLERSPSEITFHYYDIDNEFFNAVQDGSNFGRRDNGSAVSIIPFASFEMQLIPEITGENSLIIESHLPDKLSQVSGNQLILWRLNEETDIYEEESIVDISQDSFLYQASKNGVYMIGTPYPLVSLTGNIRAESPAEESFPLQDASLRLSIDNQSYIQSNTNNDGSFTFFAPQNVPLTLEVENDCGEILMTNNISPISDDKNLGDITIGSNSISLMKLSVNNCKGQSDDRIRAISSPQNKWHIFSANQNGTINIPQLDCNPLESSYNVINNMDKKLFPGLIQPADSHIELKSLNNCDSVLIRVNSDKYGLSELVGKSTYALTNNNETTSLDFETSKYNMALEINSSSSEITSLQATFTDGQTIDFDNPDMISQMNNSTENSFNISAAVPIPGTSSDYLYLILSNVEKED